MAEIYIEWSGIPVGKGRPRAFRTKGGGIRTYTPDKTVDFEERIKFAARRAMVDKGYIDLFTKAVRVEVCARFPIPKSMSKAARILIAAGADAHTNKPDADNVLKAILDAMNGTVLQDDKLAADVRIRKRYSDEPGVSIYVSTL